LDLSFSVCLNPFVFSVRLGLNSSDQYPSIFDTRSIHSNPTFSRISASAASPVASLIASTCL
jgi:hypothetical protein